MASSQRYALNKSKLLPPLPEQFDVAIAWTELTALYALTRVAEARHTAAWIHPDYVQAGFRAEIDAPVFAEIDRVVAVSESGRATLETVFPQYRGKFLAIRNTVAGDRAREAAAAPLGSDAAWFEGPCTVVTVCRLHDQSKALVRAVRMTAELRRRGVRFRWVVVGEGPDRGRIEGAIADQGVADSFVLVGYRDNPLPLVAAADGFVLQSYYEGMPVAVDEAIALGTPVLVTEYAAACEQVHSPALGRVVANEEEALIEALEEWISGLGDREHGSPERLRSAAKDDFEELLEWLRPVKWVEE